MIIQFNDENRFTTHLAGIIDLQLSNNFIIIRSMFNETVQINMLSYNSKKEATKDIEMAATRLNDHLIKTNSLEEKPELGYVTNACGYEEHHECDMEEDYDCASAGFNLISRSI